MKKIAVQVSAVSSYPRLAARVCHGAKKRSGRIIAGFLLLFMSPLVLAVSVDAGDYDYVPAGTQLGLLYYQYSSGDSLYVGGRKVSDDARARAQVGILRVVKYLDVGGVTVAPQVLLPFGAVQTAGDLDGASVRNGMGDLILASTVFLYKDDQRRVLGITPRAPAATRMTLIIILDLEAKQFGAILVRGGGKQPLGLDAGFTGRVQPQEIERDVAHQRQVVGDMAGAAACVVIAELDIEAPVQAVLHLPVTSYGMGDLVGLRRQTADVVPALHGGPVADGARALDHGEASDIAPLLGFVEPIPNLESLAAADLIAPMTARAGLARAHRDQWLLETDMGQKDGFEQLRMIVLHAQHVVSLPLTDLVGNRRLRAHRVDGHDAVLDVERAQQLGDRGDLIRFLRGRGLPEHDADFGGERANHVQRFSRSLAGRAPARLAVDGDHLIAPQRRNDRPHPGPKRPLEALRVEQRKDALEGVGRGNPVLQSQKAAQPIEFCPTPLRDVLEIVGAAQYRAHRHRQQFAQNMPRLLRTAPVLEPFEHFDHRRQLFRFHGSAKKPGNYTKSASVNRGFVSV